MDVPREGTRSVAARAEAKVSCRFCPRGLEPHDDTRQIQAKRKIREEKEAMTEALLARLAQPSFPPELRAMVITALVRHGLPPPDFRKSFNHVAKAPTTVLLLPERLEGIDKMSRGIIRQAVNDAVFSTILFTMDLLFKYKNSGLSPYSPTVLHGKDHAIRYLQVDVDLHAKRRIGV